MNPTTTTRATVLDRDEYRCVRCGCYVGFGEFSVHHRRPRGMGGTKRPESNLPANLLTLCGTGTTGCHGWVESHRTSATADGLLISQHADPELIPVHTYRGKVLLSNDGMLTIVSPSRHAVHAQDEEQGA
jgi:hypothetical protein